MLCDDLVRLSSPVCLFSLYFLNVNVSSLLGDHLCVHAGGIDLKFPHHNNEILQCEAHYSPETQWVDYFVHVGHLHIVGRKMSKSLKNFITISDLLEKYSANQFRLFCLSHKYNSNIEYSEERMEEAKHLEDKFTHFFHKVKHYSDFSVQIESTKWSEKEKKLNKSFLQAQVEIREHLQNDFDTPEALRVLLGLVSEVNSYLSHFFSTEKSELSPNPFLLSAVADFIAKLVSEVFGLRFGEKISKVKEESKEEQVVRVLVDFRNSVRSLAKSKSPQAKFFQLCDEVRDRQLPQLGYILEVTKLFSNFFTFFLNKKQQDTPQDSILKKK